MANHRQADSNTPPLKSEFSPFRTAVATVGLLLSVLGVIVWFWVTSVSAQTEMLQNRVSVLDKTVAVQSERYERDMQYIKQSLEEIKGSLKTQEGR